MRLIDYLNYDAALKHASVFVNNAGLGGVFHSVVNGVPMVLAGETEDKPEAAMRAEFAGIAVNLRTGRPTSNALREAVDKVLAEPRYKKNIMKIKEENEKCRTVEAVEQQVMEFAREHR